MFEHHNGILNCGSSPIELGRQYVVYAEKWWYTNGMNVIAVRKVE